MAEYGELSVGLRKLLLLSTLIMARGSMAACLLTDYSVKAEYDRSDAVAVAQVVSERVVPPSKGEDSLGGTLYTVKIEEWLRRAPRDTVEVFSENSRFPMKRGVPYLLFLYEAQGQLSADNCGNSGPISDKKNALDIVPQLAEAKR